MCTVQLFTTLYFTKNVGQKEPEKSTVISATLTALTAATISLSYQSTFGFTWSLTLPEQDAEIMKIVGSVGCHRSFLCCGRDFFPSALLVLPESGNTKYPEKLLNFTSWSYAVSDVNFHEFTSLPVKVAVLAQIISEFDAASVTKSAPPQRRQTLHGRECRRWHCLKIKPISIKWRELLHYPQFFLTFGK